MVSANKSLNCVGHVDVITEASTVKQLLKLPYATAGTGALSMMVHRIGRTLLLDAAAANVHHTRAAQHRQRRASYDGELQRAMAAKLTAVCSC